MTARNGWRRPPADRQKRVTVSFSGLDGAGKTRQIDALVANLPQAKGELTVVWVPFRIWPEPILMRLPASFRSRLGPRRSTIGTATMPGSDRPRDAPAEPRWERKLLWTIIGAIAAISAGWSLRRRLSKISASVVILDRYRLDSIVKLQYWYPDVPARMISWLVMGLAPAPDAEFLLRVGPDVAYSRKPEQWSVEALGRQADLYEQLAQAYSSVVVFDAHQEPDALASAIHGSFVTARMSSARPTR